MVKDVPVLNRNVGPENFEILNFEIEILLGSPKAISKMLVPYES